jgi:hypothetical protein
MFSDGHQREDMKCLPTEHEEPRPHGMLPKRRLRLQRRVLVTIHPSLLLRIEDAASKAEQYRQFVADLRIAARFARAAAA